MAELGSVFDEDGDGPRGPDLRIVVEVPRAALGNTLSTRVPRRLAADGDLVDRVIDETLEDPEMLLVHLPDTLPDRAGLRLRSQGGIGPDGGRPGDLHVVCELVDRPPHPGEVIVRSIAHRAEAGVTPADGPDVTWYLLGALAIIGAVVLALVAF